MGIYTTIYYTDFELSVKIIWQSIQLFGKLLTGQLFFPTTHGLFFLLFAYDIGFGIFRAVAKFQQQSGFLDFLFKFTQGLFHIAVGHYHTASIQFSTQV